MADKKKQWVGAVLLLLSGVGLAVYGVRGKGSDGSSPVLEETEALPEVDHIIMTYQTLEISDTRDLDQILEAVNEISREEIGVEVELKVSAAIDSFTEYPLWLSQGEPIDLMILNYQDITGYVKTHMIRPIDRLLETYGSGIEEVIASGDELSQGAVFQEKTYGVTNIFENSGTGGGIWISEEKLQNAGISYRKDYIYSLDEIDGILETLKETYPNSYPLGQITTDATATTYLYYCENPANLSGSFGTGIWKNGRVCDFYETDEYYQFLERLCGWYEKGYIFPDAAFTDESQKDLYDSEIILSKPFNSEPGMADELNGDDLVCLQTTEIWQRKRSEKSGFWVIPETSKHPAAAMKFLNLMLTDTRVGNLLKWGIEGIHYATNANGMISYPEGKNRMTVGYYNPMTLYGNYSKVARMQSKEQEEELAEYIKKIRKEETMYPGFVYDKTGVADRLVLIQNVLETYLPLLESGSVDLEIYYPRFVEALKQAGIDEVVSDKERQLYEWMGTKTEKQTEDETKETDAEGGRAVTG